MDDKADVMRDEMELMKHIPIIVKAQKIIGDIGKRESLFFFGKCKLRGSWKYEVAAFVMALVLDALIITVALAATISIWTWLV